MMDWTDRHCRYFHRLLSRRTLLYTEMVVDEAILHGDVSRLLAFAPEEHPVAVQLGGSDPAKLAKAARIAEQAGFDEINLNVGCPSDRVRAGTFGACLMREPQLVGDCVSAMKAVVDVPVTVKCRLGVDDQDTGPALDNLADSVIAAGCDGLWVHARKAWLKGLSPKDNRSIPPLDYGRVIALKERLPSFFVGINGGLLSLDQADGLLDRLDGAMFGRAAYQTPAILAEIDARYFGAVDPVDLADVVEAMIFYAERQAAGGVRLAQITRHMLGLFHGKPGARQWRRVLSTKGADRDARPEILREAFQAVDLSSRDTAIPRIRDMQPA